jgi:hypothetical protein
MSFNIFAERTVEADGHVIRKVKTNGMHYWELLNFSGVHAIGPNEEDMPRLLNISYRRYLWRSMMSYHLWFLAGTPYAPMVLDCWPGTVPSIGASLLFLGARSAFHQDGRSESRPRFMIAIPFS